MSANIIRKYITQDFDENDKHSYKSYINGNKQSTLWVEKALLRREPLLLLELTCEIPIGHNILCNGWVDIKETGTCKCSNGHYCYDQVIQVIASIT